MRHARFAVLACLLMLAAVLPAGVAAQTPTPSAGPTGTIMSGSVPPDGGFGLVVFGGGSYQQLVTASRCDVAQVAFWVTRDGQFLIFVPGSAVGAVNAPFMAALPNDFIPYGTLLLGRCQPRPGGGGVQGTVTLGPLCPVSTPLLPCPDRPYQATLVFLDGNGREVARTVSGIDGRYRIGLPPGAYTLVPLSPPGAILPRASSVLVLVPADRYLTVDVAYDTGIRTVQSAPLGAAAP